MEMLWSATGAFLAALFVLAASRTRSAEKTNAVGLLIAAIIYVGFALFGGAEVDWIAIEVSGVAVYGIFAWLGVKKSSAWLTAGWIAHIAWDVGLHQYGSGRFFTPEWYPPLCIGFDLAVAIWLIWIASNRKQFWVT